MKPGGRLSISDVVATAELPEHIRHDLTMMAGCIAAAEYVEDIRAMLQNTRASTRVSKDLSAKGRFLFTETLLSNLD